MTSALPLPCDLKVVMNDGGYTTNYPCHLYMTTDDIHKSLLQNTNYGHGYPGMNRIAWVRVGDFYNLVSSYFSFGRDINGFKTWLQEVGKTTEEDAEKCYSALSQKYGYL